MDENYYRRRAEEIIEKLRNRPPMPEPIDVLPKLPATRKDRFKSVEDYQIRSARGHYEVYKNGRFYCSADTKAEAWDEIWS